jgi:hypothetical protein
MAMLTLLVGRSTTDTRSSTTVIAAPGQSTAQTTRSSPSAAPNLVVPPWGGSWFDNLKGK